MGLVLQDRDSHAITITPVDKARLYAEWQHANLRVREAEERLGGAWANGGLPDRALLDEVTRERRECDKKLAAILGEFTDSDSSKPDNPSGRHAA